MTDETTCTPADQQWAPLLLCMFTRCSFFRLFLITEDHASPLSCQPVTIGSVLLNYEQEQKIARKTINLQHLRGSSFIRFWLRNFGHAWQFTHKTRRDKHHRVKLVKCVLSVWQGPVNVHLMASSEATVEQISVHVLLKCFNRVFMNNLGSCGWKTSSFTPSTSAVPVFI